MPPIKPQGLALLVKEQAGSASLPAESIPYPTPDGVLYAPPNPDGSAKTCSNCCLWAAADRECLIHEEGLEIKATQVCGYHVFGPPQDSATAIVRPPGIPPELSGLIEAPAGGTSCSNCRYFSAPSTCSAVADPETGSPPAEVEPLGCCARWDGAQ